jgi:stage V sporulation protein AA
LTLGHLVELRGPARAVERVRRQPFGQAPGPGGHRVVPLLDVVAAIQRTAPGVRWQILGDADPIVEAPGPEGRRWWWAAAAWVLLFVGAATTLLNFHADVNMPAAHRELYRIATGRDSARPLVIEVPYAIGVGLGALLFFVLPGDRRHPGPLELEVDRYEHRVRAYWRGLHARRRQDGP